jgi:hypothetical protein
MELQVQLQEGIFLAGVVVGHHLEDHLHQEELVEELLEFLEVQDLLHRPILVVVADRDQM